MAAFWTSFVIAESVNDVSDGYLAARAVIAPSVGGERVKVIKGGVRPRLVTSKLISRSQGRRQQMRQNL